MLSFQRSGLGNGGDYVTKSEKSGIHPYLIVSARGQMLTGVLVVDKYGHNFTGEPKFMYRGQHDYRNCLHKFLSGVCQFEVGVSFVRHFMQGKFNACPGTDFT